MAFIPQSSNSDEYHCSIMVQKWILLVLTILFCRGSLRESYLGEVLFFGGGAVAAFKAIYVTGAPASGKSSTMAMLRNRISGLNVWEYGARLTTFVKERGAPLTDQDELRAKSAGIVTPADIDALDSQLLDWTARSRLTGPCVIDSHPVTKEEYGFRVTAFSAARFRHLAPDEIWLFYVDPEVTIDRIAHRAAGRPMISLEEARMHSAAQASIASTYGVISGCPVYMFDTNVDQAKLVDRLAQRLGDGSRAEQGGAPQ